MSKRIRLPIEYVQQLPTDYRSTIPESYLDVMGHMNIRWYMALFNEGVLPFLQRIGLTQAYIDRENCGAFALEHFVRYLAEVHVGQTVTIHTRVVGRSAKRLHFMQFMANETTGSVAATLEILNSHADLAVRRTSPYPREITDKIDVLLAEHAQLTWEVPICGAMTP
ncbi:MAG: thioesterase family protein [Chloroflexota bacterium]